MHYLLVVYKVIFLGQTREKGHLPLTVWDPKIYHPLNLGRQFCDTFKNNINILVIHRRSTRKKSSQKQQMTETQTKGKAKATKRSKK